MNNAYSDPVDIEDDDIEVETNLNASAPDGGYDSDFSSDLQWRDDLPDIINVSDTEDDVTEDNEAAEESTENTDGVRDSADPAVLSDGNDSPDRNGADYQLLGKKSSDFKARRRRLFRREDSFIMRSSDNITEKLYTKTQNGVIGHFFTSYAKAERGVNTSLILSLPKKISAFFEKRRLAKMKREEVRDDDTGEVVAVIHDPASRKRSIVRRTVSAFEKSSVITALKKLFSTLFYLPVATYGAALLSLGITTILVQAAKAFWLSAAFSLSGVVVGILYTLIGVMAIFAGDTPLARYVCESKAGSFLLVSVFGVSKKSVDLERSVPKYRFWAFLIGVGLGLLSALVQAWSMLVFAIVAVIALGIAHNPESGVVLALFALPLTSLIQNGDKYLCTAMFYTAAVWIIKTIGGKRRIGFGALEGWIALFGCFVILTGFVSADSAEAGEHVFKMIGAMLGFFTVSTLLSSRTWMRRGINALLFSGFLVSVLGIYEWIEKAIRVSWKPEKILENEISSVFLSTDTLALYLMVVFFFASVGVGTHENKKEKLFSLLTLLVTFVCLVFTVEVYVWVTIVVVSTLCSLVRSRKNAFAAIAFIVILVLAVVFVFDALPPYVAQIADGALDENLEVLRIGSDMSGKYAISGIGLGDTVFKNVYASFVQVGGNISSNGGSLLFDVIIRFGVMGAIFLITAMVLVYRQSLSTLKHATVRRYASLWSLAALGALSGALSVSLVSYIWSDFSMALLFWMLVGFISAARRLSIFENTGMADDEGISITLPIRSFRKIIRAKSKNN